LPSTIGPFPANATSVGPWAIRKDSNGVIQAIGPYPVH
jgi:hypothetical protein